MYTTVSSGFRRVIGREVEQALHCGEVGVGTLNDQPGAHASGRVVADVPVEHHHVALGNELVLGFRQCVVPLARDDRIGVLLRCVRDDKVEPLNERSPS